MIKYIFLLVVSVQMIDIKDNSTVVVHSVSENFYVRSLKATKVAFDEQVIKSLDSIENQKGWKLQKVVVGIGVNGEIGFGPWKIGKYVKQRFGYSR